MSGKRAKQERREEAEAQAVTKIGTVTIDVYSNLDVNVSNFPSEHDVAMMIMANAMLKVSHYFAEGQQKEKSDILIAKQGATPADIIKMAQGN